MANQTKTWIVVVVAEPSTPTGSHAIAYLMDGDCGRQGTANPANATRFTRVGASRVARAHGRNAYAVPASDCPEMSEITHFDGECTACRQRCSGDMTMIRWRNREVYACGRNKCEQALKVAFISALVGAS